MFTRKVVTFLFMSLFVLGMLGIAMALPPGQVREWDTPAGKAKFDGGFHASKGLVCNDCHAAVFSMDKAANEKNKMTMAEMKEGKFCGHCHNGQEKTIKDAKITIFSATDPANCSRCHTK